MLRLRESHIIWREVDGETLVLDLRDSMYLSVNESAGVLWRVLAGGTTRDGLIDALATEYDLDRDEAAADVDAFLEDCRARDYLDEDTQ